MVRRQVGTISAFCEDNMDSMNRRSFIVALGSTAAGICTGCVLEKRQKIGQDYFQLSDNGCGRATGYSLSHKIVTVEDKTHVAWLDSVAGEGFRVRVRTLNRASGQWSPSHSIGAAVDNHGGPALTVDSQGFLHILYYPHGNPFYYRKSKYPNDASSWEPEIQFGEGLTYPTFLCGPDDTLYLTCRNTSTKVGQLELWTKRPGSDWAHERVLAKVRYSGYAAFSEQICMDPSSYMLHMALRFHEHSDRDAYGRLQRIAYMQSPDFGKTWQRSDGRKLELPVTSETIETLSTGGVEFGRIMQVGGISLDSDGTPHLVYSVREGLRSETFLAVLHRPGHWDQKSLASLLPERVRDVSLSNPAGVTFASRGKMTITAHTQQLVSGEKEWGHVSNEVVQLISTNHGKSFELHQASRPDPNTANWLANVERPGLFHSRRNKPGLIYTAGPPGQYLRDILSNGVWWVL